MQRWLALCFTAVCATALAACSGGGASVAPASPTTASPTTGGKPTATPGPTTAPGPTATPATTPTPSAPPASTFAAPTAPPDAPGHTNAIPSPPPPGTSRPGQIYNVYIQAPTGDTVAMTVFEPATVTAGQTYPLVLHSHGFGGSRTTSLASSSSPTDAFTGSANTGGNIPPLVAANYGVISFDERGHGETTGTIRVMDPDAEGVDDLAVMDWAQAKLDWLAYAPTLDGVDGREPVMGSIGGSYGGMYQYMLLNVDKRHRLRAIVPQIAPSNLNFSLFQNDVIKAEWDTVLFGLGQQAGSGTNRFNFDPFVNQTLVNDIAANAEDAYAKDFFGYHSADYFCNGTSFATNGGAGTMPLRMPTTVPPKVNAMIWIGVRDTLFNFNNGYNNYSCLKRGGGDVRLLSYQAGHNSANIVADPGLAFLPSQDNQDTRCGKIGEDAATLAFFDEYLRGKTGAASAIPRSPCISLAAGDGVTVPQVRTGTSGTLFDIGSLAVVAGAQVDVPVATATLVTGGSNGTVVAGIPHAVIDVSAVGGVAVGEPIVYVALAVQHASAPGVYDVVDNQYTPLRGIGHHDVDLVGGGVRLAPGDTLSLVAYGGQDQYVYSGSVNAAKPAVVPVTLTGSVRVPVEPNATPI